MLNTKEKLAAPFVDKDTFFNLTRMYAKAHRKYVPDPPISPVAPFPLAAGGSSSVRDELRLFHSQEEAVKEAESVSQDLEWIDGRKEVAWIDENLNPFTGDWISRTILRRWGWPANKGGRERGKDYNHSTFVDIIIVGIIGIRPRPSNELLVVNPLIPSDETWYLPCLLALDLYSKQSLNNLPFDQIV